MVDPLSFIIIYVILTVASSISSNVASSGVFEILKPKIWKNRDSQEIKEALEEVIKNLKEKNYEKEWKELQERMEEIIEKTLEKYLSALDDLASMKDDILTALIKNTDEQQGNKEAIEELKRLILEYDLPEPYLVLTGGELSDFEVTLRPPFKVEPVERPELDELINKNLNTFIIGKPGIGKTLFLYLMAKRLNPERIVWIKPHFLENDVTRLLREDLSGNILLVWDDIQNNADIFYRTVLKLTDRNGKFQIICAARSTERDKIEVIPVSFWEDFKFTEKEIPLFSYEEKKELIRRCSEERNIGIADDVAGELNEKSDGTPLYVISVFLDERYKEAGRILMGDVQTLPANVVDLWRRYFQMLEGHEKALLRCLMILSKVNVRGVKPVVEKFYLFNRNTYSEFCDALERLEKQLWVVRTEYGYDCHDVQLEAVPFEGGILERLKEFILTEGLNVYIVFLLDFGISRFHYAEIARAGDYSVRIFHVVESIKYSKKSLKICRDLGLRADLSASLNNASSFYSQLSSLQQTREERLGSIQTAVKYIEEAIGIRRDLGLRADLSGSLNNASNLYSVLSSLQQTREERLGSIQTAVKYIEEAIGIRRDLGLRADLSMSLNNASNLYSELSSLQQTREEKHRSLQIAVTYIEEAIQIGKDLGLILNLAYSMAVSVFVYDSYLEFDSKVFTKAMTNCDQAINIFLEFRLKDKYCLLLPFGIKYHHHMYTITQSPEHRAIINTYQQLLTQCPQ